MKKPSLLYIPLFVLFALALSVLAIHWGNVFKRFNVAGSRIEMPSIAGGEVTSLRPAEEKAGLKVKDKLIAVNGRAVKTTDDYLEETAKANPDQNMNLTVARIASDGQIENLEISFKPSTIERDVTFYSRFVAGFLFTYFLPTMCILLGFYVVLVRPKDLLAWFLLFMLLGFSSIALESYARNTVIGFYNSIFYSSWALSMFLFALYFPERWSMDKKIPWAKWILIIPLGFQVFLVLLDNLKLFLGIDIIDYLDFIIKPYNSISTFLNMFAIGMFFFIIGVKSGTLKAPDARRRMRLMLYGTLAAMLPTFIIIVSGIFIGKGGSFFDRVPFWLAISALLLLLLFPLTMAYVIVVHRAMDVSVVVRQGLQYALAKNGVRFLQIIFSAAVIITAFSFVSDAQTNRPQKMIFIALGVTGVLLIRLTAEKLKAWTDRRFFREEYNAEQILSDLSEEVRTMIETKPLLEMVSNRISQSLHVPQVALLLKNGNTFQPAYALGYETAPLVSLTETDKTIEKLKTNEPFVIYQDEKDSWINEGIQAGERESLQKLNSQLLLPVGAKNGLSGVISLSPKLSESPYTPTDLRLLKSVAAQTGLALENSRLTETIVAETAQREQEKARFAIVEAENERRAKELEGARQLQLSMLPKKLPQIPNLEIAAFMKPATEVGGDYYDFHVGEEGTLTVAVGDATGHGLKAGTLVSATKSLFNAFADDSDIVQTFKRSSAALKKMNLRGLFMAMTMLKIKDGKVTLSCAGMPPVLIYRAETGQVEEISIKAMPLGSVSSFPYKQEQFDLQPGDCVVMMSDGFPEMFNEQDEMIGFEKGAEILPEIAGASPQEIINRFIEAGEQWAGARPQDDDVTFVVLKVKTDNSDDN